MALLGCAVCGGEMEKALPAALSVELLHNFTLIHDDIMDSAGTRRNQLSVYKKWDSNTAILSGDVLFAHAFEQLEHYGKDDSYSRQQYLAIHQTFLQAVINVCRGQALDMEFEAREMVSLDEYLAMIDAKTAALLGCSLKLGALAALAPPDLAEAASAIGYHAGIAFQIQDDLLDVAGDTATFGKEVGGDIREGKKTWLTIAAFNAAGDGQRELLRKVLKKQSAKQTDIEIVKTIYRELNIIRDAERVIAHHYKKAQACLDQFENSKHKDEINNLLHQLMVRES